MFDLMNYPFVIFVVSLLVMWLAARVGLALPRRQQNLEGVREDFGIILGATLTLLGLIIGFTFSMAIARYDQRKNLEEEEANAIGTEYVRADLLPPAEAAKVRTLLEQYLQERLTFYSVKNYQMSELPGINARISQLQDELWKAVAVPGAANPNQVTALAVSGMNDVLNSQGYTQAAWWNRIPIAAWVLMASIAIFCNLLIGYGAHQPRKSLLVVLPLLVALSFLLIADIDSPRGGVIRVKPNNLISLQQSLRPH
jgi:hypothetical protein